MFFNSISFFIFLPVVFFLYWFVTNKSLKEQNLLLLFSSYFFYSCWDWRFLFLLFFSTLLDYYSGIKIAQAPSASRRKFWLWLSIGINVGFLGVFKYFNFFTDSFAKSVSYIGWDINPLSLNVILPVGISFYTFHGLSYVIDIYKKKISPEKNFINYSVFVSFFPLLVAGPIERATHLLPQIQKKRLFDFHHAVDGLKQILWGLFKKIVIADLCAQHANAIFNHYNEFHGAMLALGALFFTIQIYCDFSGYSDIALGVAKLFGINLLRNFAFPYFSRDIAEFWRRWHISLSTWFRDYLYIPLGGSKGGTWMKVRNTFIIFLVSGFWHGANWTFIAWGVLNALYIMPSILRKTNRANLNIVAQNRVFPTAGELFSILLTFSLTVFAWIFFRSESIDDAVTFIARLVAGLADGNAYAEAWYFLLNIGPALPLLIIVFILIEWSGREHQYAIAALGQSRRRAIRWGFYYLLIIAIFIFGGAKQQFIYFQF